MQEFPDDLKPDNLTEQAGHSQYLTEVERRENYFNLLSHHGQYYELTQLAKDCLHNTPSMRPTARQIVCALEAMRDEKSGVYELLDAVKKVAMTYQSSQTWLNSNATNRVKVTDH